MLIFIIVLVLFSLLLIYRNSYETLNFADQITSKTCPPFIKRNSNFCGLDSDTNKCKCVFQKDDVKTNFNSPPACCDRYCAGLSPSECTAKRGIYYWCIDNKSNTCREKSAYIDDNRISGNNCGIDNLTNEILAPYHTKQECCNAIDPCKSNKNQSSCIAAKGCGWCKNTQGVGQCLEGTPSGPINIYKYPFCYANKLSNNAWSFAIPPFIM